ncbi:SIS domain-containing protein [Paraclostridium ghonii]|uniref:MurR/RpiR family transcriptional regulator n=1 Tax=Paraclostridium ghonii TaxID=29358 RepID=UPI00202CAB6B|nr:SIS domain-containing protein [Paeniclostridium ghonii]MCM0166197.1 SIS domain-containing protein [Paeniclostridium ghonii]
MININWDNLNQLERRLYKTIFKAVQDDKNLNIIKASEICEVSSSKISKTVKKLGFKNYKDFIKFCRGELSELDDKSYSDELNRLNNYIKSFDENIVTEFIEKISKFDKIVIYGLGPSFICCQYLEYKLRMCTSKTVLAINDEIQIKNVVDSDTLFIIFSVTGKFSSFENVCNIVNQKKGEILIIFEEYNNNNYPYASNIMYLSKFKQNNKLAPYEKTRTILFIFIEEIIQKLLN